MTFRMRHSFAAPLLSVVLAAGAVAQTAGSQPEAAAEAPATSARATNTDFEQTAEPRWEYETVVPIEEEAPVQPTDPKLIQVHAELDRMQGLPAAPGPETPARRSGFGLGTVLRAISGLFIVIALILLCTYLLKRFGSRTPLLAGSDLGAILGKLYLSPRASLHFVRSGGRVLVIGVTQNNISLVSEFDAAAFEALLAPQQATEPTGQAQRAGASSKEKDTASFLAHLKASANELRGEPLTGDVAQPAQSPDEDIDSLRSDIARLQKYLKDNLRED